MKQDNQKTVYGAIAMFLILLMLFFSVKRSERITKELNELKTAKNEARTFLIDSMKVEMNKEKVRELDIQRAAYENDLANLQKKGAQLKIVYKDKLIKVDTTSYSVSCVDALKACDEYASNRDFTIDTLELINDNLIQVITKQDSTIFILDNGLLYAKKNLVQLRQFIAKQPKVKAIQPYVIIGSDIKFTTQKIQVGVDLGRKVLVGVSGVRCYDNAGYTIDLGYKF